MRSSAGKRLGILLAAVLFSACSPRGTSSTASRTTPIQTLTPIETASPITIPIPTRTPAATPTAVPDIPPLSGDQIKPQVDQLAAKFFRITRNTGLSVAIVLRNPATAELEAGIFNYGVTSDQADQPVASNTIYEIGSLTKLFTGILLAQAVVNGKVKLDDPIQQYLPPEVHSPTYKGVSISLVELATHRSGLPRDPSNRHIPRPFSEGYSQQDLYAWLNGYDLTRVPGWEYEYSNAGFAVLGEILSGLAGEDYGQLEWKAISQPLGMKDTEVVLSSEQENRLAQGFAAPGIPAPYFPQSGGMAGTGYLHSTISDLTRFVVANMQPDSTSFATALELAQTYQTQAVGTHQGMGLGWQISDPGQSDERLWKRGQTNGFTSYISFAQDGSSGFVLLTNGPGVESLVPGFLRLLGETTY